MNDIQYVQPKSIDELTGLLGQMDAGFQAVAGTTDFIPQARQGVPYPPALVDVSRVAEFRQIGEMDGKMFVGAAVTMAELMSNALIVDKCQVLACAAKSMGSPLVRNRATIGGNIANASPSADTAPVLLALDADIHFVSASGTKRHMPMTEFYLDYKKTGRKDGEIISGFSFAPPAEDAWTRFAKVGQRSGATISVVNMALVLKKEGDTCTHLAVAFGAVAPVPLRAYSVEKEARGNQFGEEFVAACAKAVQQDISPIGDIRGSEEYRRLVAANILSRALADAFA